MGIIGIPECAVSGNASEVPDEISGETGVHARIEIDNGSSEPQIEVVTSAQAEGLVAGPTDPQG